MAARPRKRRQLTPPPAVMTPKRIVLSDARLEALDPAERAEIERLTTEGYSQHLIYVSDSPNNPYYRRYEELVQRAENKLREKLTSDSWLATGRNPGDPIDAPRVAIPCERFKFLEFDFDRTALQGDGVRITEVLVSTAGAIRLFQSSKQGRLGAHYLQLSEQSFDLLSILAKWAKRGEPLVPNRVLKDKVFSKATNDKALGQGVSDLWKHLQRSGMNRTSARSLVVNVPRRGYFLNLPRVEIFIDEEGHH